jgi:holo-[acyl-carrier protein] synthase
MIVGIGVDLVELPRVKRMLAQKGERMLRRLFTDAEAAYANARKNPIPHLAARLAAKEAAYKAFSGTDDARAIGWREIEVVSHLDGRPELVFHGRAAARAAELGVKKVWISLTHTPGAAAAVVVLEREP